MRGQQSFVVPPRSVRRKKTDKRCRIRQPPPFDARRSFFVLSDYRDPVTDPAISDHHSSSGVHAWEGAAALVALAAFAFAVLQWGLAGAVHSRKTQTVPDLKGRSLGAALDQLAELN